MSTEANKALMLRLNEAIAAGRLHELEGHPDLWETRQIMPMMHITFADWRLGPLLQLAEGAWVCSYGASTMQHVGQFAGVAASGRRIGLEVISFDRIEDGKVMAHNSASTTYDALPVLGAHGFDAWPVRPAPTAIRPPVPSDEPTPPVMHELLAALCAGDWDAAEQHSGVGDILEQFRTLRAAFSGLSYRPVSQIIEGDMAATRGTLSGTHSGELYGIAATGQPASWEYFTIARIRNGAITEQRAICDWNSGLRQLGIFTSPTEAPSAKAPGQ